MSILKLLASDNYITVNKTLIQEVGLEEAVLFGILCSEQTFWESQNKLINGYFFCTVDKIECLTSLSDYKQRKIIKHLEELGYIKTKVQGLPATRYFKINEEQVLKLFDISSQKIKELDIKKLRLSNNQNNNNQNNNNQNNNITTDGHSNNFLGSSKSKKKPGLYNQCAGLINIYTEDTQLRQKLFEYLNMRLQMKDKPLKYVNQWKGLLNNLTELSFNTSEQIAIVNQSIIKGWAGFYNIHQNNRNGFVDNIESNIQDNLNNKLSNQTF